MRAHAGRVHTHTVRIRSTRAYDLISRFTKLVLLGFHVTAGMCNTPYAYAYVS